LFSGVKFGGDYSVVRNCRIHNNSQNGFEAHNGKKIVIENNLIEFNGDDPQFDHGIYISGDNFTIRNNIVRFNSSLGMALGINDSVIQNNLVHANKHYAMWLKVDHKKLPNRIINNTVVENQYGICFAKSGADIVANNIIISKSSSLPAVLGFKKHDISKVEVSNNLMDPLNKGFDSTNFTAAPKFTKPKQGLFFLKSDSPAIGKGSLKYKPQNDLFDRPRKESGPVDLGCYSFDPKLLTPQATENLYLGWAFHPLGRHEIPDLWKFPD
jgi:parallel beta-helix repeat protein